MDNQVEITPSLWDSLCQGYKANLWLSNEFAEVVNLAEEEILAENWFFSPLEHCTRICKLYKDFFVVYSDSFQPKLLKIMELDLVKCYFEQVDKSSVIRFTKNT